MGLTPLEGLPGGTRSGSVDPSLVFHLFGQEQAAHDVTSKGITVSKGEFALNKSAGVCGSFLIDFGFYIDGAHGFSCKGYVTLQIIKPSQRRRPKGRRKKL